MWIADRVDQHKARHFHEGRLLPGAGWDRPPSGNTKPCVPYNVVTFRLPPGYRPSRDNLIDESGGGLIVIYGVESRSEFRSRPQGRESVFHFDSDPVTSTASPSAAGRPVRTGAPRRLSYQPELAVARYCAGDVAGERGDRPAGVQAVAGRWWNRRRFPSRHMPRTWSGICPRIRSSICRVAGAARQQHVRHVRQVLQRLEELPARR